MKIYDYSKTKNCFICGSIDGNFDKFIKIVINSLRDTKSYVVETHPKEIERQERIARKMAEERSNNGGEFGFDMGTIMPQHFSHRRLKKTSFKNFYGNCLTEAILIVDGCNGFGERDLKFYYDKLEMLNKVLADNNTHILFVRGSDDPKYFEDGLIDLSNIKTISDYAVVKLSKFNCLCIGGCVSIDRTWKMEQEKRIGRKMYWENEKIQYNEKEINKILEYFNIACVVTTSCPSFAYPGMNSFKRSSWAVKDKYLKKDIAEERMIMDEIYSRIVENNKKPYIWVYSRFKNSNQSMINDILFQSLNSFHFFNFNENASHFFGIDFSKTLKQNEYVPSGNKVSSLKSRLHENEINIEEPEMDIEEDMPNEENEEINHDDLLGLNELLNRAYTTTFIQENTINAAQLNTHNLEDFAWHPVDARWNQTLTTTDATITTNTLNTNNGE